VFIESEVSGSLATPSRYIRNDLGSHIVRIVICGIMHLRNHVLHCFQSLENVLKCVKVPADAGYCDSQGRALLVYEGRS
jgi:hypothetical protein